MASAVASTEASAEAIASLKAAGVTAEGVAAAQSFYAQTAAVAEAAGTPNLAALQRAALFANILGRY